MKGTPYIYQGEELGMTNVPFDSLEEFGRAYREFIEKSLLPLREQGLCGAVYTQVSDVEEEVNGLLTYDRKVNKLV